MGYDGFSDDALRNAAAQVRVSMLDALPEPAACTCDFSPSFEQKIVLLRQRAKRKQRRLTFMRQSAAVFLVLLVGAGGWLAVDAEARTSLLNWVRSVYEDYVLYSFHGKSDTAGIGQLPRYAPGWLPAGFTQTKHSDGYTTRLAEYDNAQSGEVILFSYTSIEGELATAYFTDGERMELRTVNGHAAHFYPAEGPSDSSNLVWVDEEQLIVFSLNGTVSEDILLRIAESVKVQK